MGEIKTASIVEILLFSRRYIKASVGRENFNQSDYMLLSIAIVQYMLAMCAAIRDAFSDSSVTSHTVYPKDVFKFLPDRYRLLASTIIRNRNLVCHTLGSDDCLMRINEGLKNMRLIKCFIEDVILNDRLLPAKTVAKMKSQQ